MENDVIAINTELPECGAPKTPTAQKTGIDPVDVVLCTAHTVPGDLWSAEPSYNGQRRRSTATDEFNGSSDVCYERFGNIEIASEVEISTASQEYSENDSISNGLIIDEDLDEFANIQREINKMLSNECLETENITTATAVNKRAGNDEDNNEDDINEGQYYHIFYLFVKIAFNIGSTNF